MDGKGRPLRCVNERMDAKVSIMMCKLKGRIHKRGFYDVEMKRWRQKGAL